MNSHEGPVIVCGLGRVGWPVLQYCQMLGWKVIAVDNQCSAEDPRLQGIEFHRGSYRDPAILDKLPLQQARGIILLANDDLNNLAAALEIRRRSSSIRIVVRLFNENLVAKLSKTIPHVIALSSSRLSGPLLASTALSGEVLTRFHATGTDWHVEQIDIEQDSPLQKLTPASFRERFPDVTLLTYMDDETSFEHQQMILAAGPVKVLAEVRSAAKGDIDLTKWAGVFQRFARTVWTTFAEIELPVKLAALCFFSVVLTGSIICWVSGMADTLPRGLLRTLNIMVTAADLREQDYRAPWQHVFISLLKLFGLLLTAAFTALLTNYLVRVRLRGLLSISRIPEAGHVVLCGLGTVGLRVVEALREQQIPVVVLEKVEGGRFVASARQKGATVLLADGTVPASLVRAHAATARALVAATSSDLANVEIALQALDLNPRLRVIIRLEDVALAGALQQTTNIRHAMGLPPLIAPAFVWPLLGDRIVSLFWLHQALHLVMEVAVTPATTGLLQQHVELLPQKLGCWVLIQAGQIILNEG
nr:NAD-binding protein [Gemmatales bacterium]